MEGGPTWWHYWVPSHTDMRDDKVAVFATFLKAGTYEYTFNVRASVPGQYKVIPAYAEQMYFTDVWGQKCRRHIHNYPLTCDPTLPGSDPSDSRFQVRFRGTLFCRILLVEIETRGWQIRCPSPRLNSTSKNQIFVSLQSQTDDHNLSSSSPHPSLRASLRPTSKLPPVHCRHRAGGWGICDASSCNRISRSNASRRASARATISVGYIMFNLPSLVGLALHPICNL